MAKLALADSYYKTGLVCLESMKFEERFNTQLTNLADYVDEAAAQALIASAYKCRQNAKEFCSNAMANYEQACRQYEKLGQNLRRRKDEFACGAVKNLMLTLAGYAGLAQKTGEDEIADDLLFQAEELVEKAAECNGDFANSTTAELLRALAPEAVMSADGPEIPVDEEPAVVPEKEPPMSETAATDAEDTNSFD